MNRVVPAAYPGLVEVAFAGGEHTDNTLVMANAAAEKFGAMISRGCGSSAGRQSVDGALGRRETEENRGDARLFVEGREDDGKERFDG